MIATEDVLCLSEYSEAELVHASFATYLDTRWRPWAEEEKRRRRTIRLYAQLFTLQQQLEGSIVESPLRTRLGRGSRDLELRWHDRQLPAHSRLAEVSLNKVTAESRSGPVTSMPGLSWTGTLPWMIPALAVWRNSPREFFASTDATFSPFDRGTFEPLLRTAATNLDVNGAYWPDEVPPEDRSLPKADGTLRVTDTWVLFARPRTTSVFIARSGESPEACGGMQILPARGISTRY